MFKVMSSYNDLTSHLRKECKRFKFKCKMCMKKFDTRNGTHKCDRNHEEKCYICAVKASCMNVISSSTTWYILKKV